MKSTTKLAIGAAVGLAVVGTVALAMGNKGAASTSGGGGGGGGSPGLPDPLDPQGIERWVSASRPVASAPINSTVTMQTVTDAGTFTVTGTVVDPAKLNGVQPGDIAVVVVTNGGATLHGSSIYDVGTAIEVPLAAVQSVQ